MQDFDHVIIGGGVHGAALAWNLARTGAGSVLLLEAGVVAGGASGGPGKRGVRASNRDLRELPLMRTAYDIWPGLADELGGETGYERLGSLHLAEAATMAAESARDAFVAEFGVQDRLGIPTELLDAAGARRVEPELGEQVLGAALCPLDGISDHTATTRSYARAAAAAGARIVENTEVTSVGAPDKPVVSTVGGEQYRARHSLVVTANGTAPALLADGHGVVLPFWTKAPQMTIVDPPDGFRLSHLIGHHTRPLAVKPLPDGRVMLSGGRSVTWNHETGRGEVDETVSQANLADAVAVLPGLAGARIVAMDASRRDSCSPDGIPVIDRLPGDVPTYVAAGWTGHGWAIAPAVSQSLATWITDGSRPDELAPFGLARFG